MGLGTWLAMVFDVSMIALYQTRSVHLDSYDRLEHYDTSPSDCNANAWSSLGLRSSRLA
jgi:hypothetical protein